MKRKVKNQLEKVGSFALSIESFKKLLYMEQEALHYYTLGRLEEFFPAEDIYHIDGEFIYVKGDIPVLLCAHFDTVHTVKPTQDTLFHDKEKNVMWCPNGIGGDDRCGVFNILDILEKGYRPHVIFSWDEEIGGVGASKFTDNCQTYFGPTIIDKIHEVNFAIQFDRHGFSEAVYYDLDSPEFETYISNFGFKTEWGSYTDICEYCPTFGFAGVNIAAGYVNEHTDRELIYIDEMLSSNLKVIEILEDQIKNPVRYEYIELAYPSWGYSGYGGSSYANTSKYTKSNGWYYFDDIANGADSVELCDIEDDSTEIYGSGRTEFCSYCYQSRGVVNWDDSDDPVLDSLCNDCREVFKNESGLL